jgi:hypothetical protein
VTLGSQAAGGNEFLVNFARGGGRPIAALLLQNSWQQEWKDVETVDCGELSALIQLTRDGLFSGGRLYKAFPRNGQASGSNLGLHLHVTSRADLACKEAFLIFPVPLSYKDGESRTMFHQLKHCHEISALTNKTRRSR